VFVAIIEPIHQERRALIFYAVADKYKTAFFAHRNLLIFFFTQPVTHLAIVPILFVRNL